MRTIHWLMTAVFALMLTGCAGMQSGPSPETRAALAPTGKLRVAIFSAPIFAIKDPATGELKGVAVDLGKDLARRIGVPFEPVSYTALPMLIAGAKAAEWDVTFTGIDAGRAAAMDFSAPFMEVEQGYLVRAGAAIATASEVNKAGIRVGVIEKSAVDNHLSQTLKNATLVRTRNAAELNAVLRAGKVEVIAATKVALFAVAKGLPGSRVLDGRIPVEPIGMGVPKGRDTAAALYVGKFVEEAKAEGLVKSAIERAGLRGVVVAPLK